MIVLRQKEFTSTKLKALAKTEKIKKAVKDLPSKLGIGYKKVDNLERYVKKNHLTPETFKKHVEVTARPANIGETVTTKVKRKGWKKILGRLEETSNPVKEAGMVVRNPGGEEYVVKAEKFAKQYKNLGGGKYLSSGDPRTTYKTKQNIEFKTPWGTTERLERGGRIVKNGPGDLYGVAPDAFKETYKKV